MNVEPVQESNGGAPKAGPALVADDSLSALMDDELDGDGVDDALERCRTDAGWGARWAAYQVVGDVLRGSSDVLPRQAPSAFLQAVKAGLDASTTAPSLQPVPVPVVAALAPVPHEVTEAMVRQAVEGVQGAQAQGAQGAVVPEPIEAGAQAVSMVRGAAANAPVLRWKLAAGLASVAAVMAVGWGMLQQATPDANRSGAPQLAQSAPAAPAALAEPADGAPTVASASSAGSPANPAAAGVAVVVTTGQGQLIRDARLEQLLAEHRQYGGMSALQKPAGFLRNATYDVAPSR